MGTPRPQFDRVLIDGTDDQLFDYMDESGECLVVDWRSEEGVLIDELSKMIPEAGLAHEWGDAEDDIYITYRGKLHKVGLTFSRVDRYVTIRRLNEILRGAYELRVFRMTLDSDTHVFYPKPCAWWSAMEEHFPERMASDFARVTPEMDFP
jgi:hypothetical protein